MDHRLEGSQFARMDLRVLGCGKFALRRKGETEVDLSSTPCLAAVLVRPVGHDPTTPCLEEGFGK